MFVDTGSGLPEFCKPLVPERLQFRTRTYKALQSGKTIKTENAIKLLSHPSLAFTLLFWSLDCANRSRSLPSSSLMFHHHSPSLRRQRVSPVDCLTTGSGAGAGRHGGPGERKRGNRCRDGSSSSPAAPSSPAQRHHLTWPSTVCQSVSMSVARLHQMKLKMIRRRRRGRAAYVHGSCVCMCVRVGFFCALSSPVSAPVSAEGIAVSGSSVSK